jgi:hypothetical protein
MSQNPRHHFQPTSSTSERLSSCSLVSLPGTSTTPPISNSKTSLTNPAVQEWSSNHNDLLPALELPPGSVSNILTRPLSSCIPASLEYPSMIGPSTSTSPKVPWVQTSSPEHFGQVTLPASYPSLPPREKTPSVALLSTSEQNHGAVLERDLDTSHNSLKSPATYTAYSPPSTQTPVSLPSQYSGSVKPLSPATHPINISPYQAISLESSYSPGHTLQAETQNFSATNILGPVNAFELYSDHEPQTTLLCSGPFKNNLSSQQAGLELSQSIHISLYPERNRSLQATYLDSTMPTESLVETMADVSIHQPENQISFADSPNNLFFAQSHSGDTFKELSTALAWAQMSQSRFEMSGDESTGHFEGPNFSAQAPETKVNDMGELHIPHQRTVNHASASMIPPPTSPQLSQFQYQAYSPLSPISTSLSPVSAVMPSSILPEQRHWPGSTSTASTSPPTEAATPVQASAPTIQQAPPLSRSITASESRRRNQKAFLNLLDRDGYR